MFRAYLARLAREQRLDPDIETRWRQDCLVSFYSPEISAFINQFYSYEYSSSSSSAWLSPSQLDGRDAGLKLAYLGGAYFRYGVDGHFKFANSSKKMNLIEHVLKDVGCKDVRTSSRESLPCQNEVFFVPTEQLEVVFHQMPGTWALQAADSVVGLATPDELAIYHEVILAARRGSFDGCPLPTSCVTNRFTFIPMTGRGEIPASLKAHHEALEDYDQNCMILRSVRDLGADNTLVIGNDRRSPAEASIMLSRVGFDRAGTTAVVLFAYFETGPPDACGKMVASFLARRDDEWDVTHYSVQEFR